MGCAACLQRAKLIKGKSVAGFGLVSGSRIDHQAGQAGVQALSGGEG